MVGFAFHEKYNNSFINEVMFWPYCKFCNFVVYVDKILNIDSDRVSNHGGTINLDCIFLKL